jgi:hypothetical protein
MAAVHLEHMLWAQKKKKKNVQLCVPDNGWMNRLKHLERL